MLFQNVNLGKYAKFVIAAGACATVLGHAMIDGILTGEEAFNVLLTALGALGVYQVPNK